MLYNWKLEHDDETESYDRENKGLSELSELQCRQTESFQKNDIPLNL